MPLLVAPVAFQRLVDPDGEVGDGAGRGGGRDDHVPVDDRDLASVGVAAEAPPAPRWFQLYCFSDRGRDQGADRRGRRMRLRGDRADRRRAARRAAGARLSHRLRVPPDVTAPAVAAAVGSDAPITVQEVFALVDPTLTWEDLEALASDCSLPIVLKGIQTGADAALAVEHGAAGVVVSNHGGRQLDGVPATLEILPEVVDAVDGRCEVLVDGGIRRGTDVLIALGLGARAVLVGRPALWGLAVGGEAGAAAVLEILRSEIELGLVLLGCADRPSESAAEHVRAQA